MEIMIYKLFNYLFPISKAVLPYQVMAREGEVGKTGSHPDPY